MRVAAGNHLSNSWRFFARSSSATESLPMRLFFMACLHPLYRPTMVSAAHPSDDCGKKASIYFTFVTFCFEASTAAPQPQLLLTVPTSMKLSIPVPLKPDICPKR